MKLIFFTIFALFSAQFALAATDNNVDVNLHATVNRLCAIDLADNTAPVSVTSKNVTLNPQYPIRGTESTISETFISVYETCNDDFVVKFRSQNNGLKSASGELIEYHVEYDGASASSKNIGPDNLVPMELTRNAADFGTMGKYFDEKSLRIWLNRLPNYLSGNYTDLLTIEMTAP